MAETIVKRAVAIVSALVIVVLVVPLRRHAPSRPPLDPQCSESDGGLVLPPGFCASVFADTIGVARHLLVAPNGDVLVAVGDADAAGTTHMRGDKRLGAVVALRDTNHDGRADLQTRLAVGDGTGIALWHGYLFFTNSFSVMRLPWAATALGVSGSPATVIEGFPGRPGHGSLSLAIDDEGNLYVGVGSRGNVCMANGVGQDPCAQLGQRAGIWRYRADKLAQHHPLDGTQVATGVRNPVALTWSHDLRGLYALSHGRDALHQNFPRLYSARAGADSPAEEFARVEAGDDWGWPYCYQDFDRHAKLLAPEYGGDANAVGRCASAVKPLVAFPGHWAPDGVVIYSGEMFPAPYRGGAFIAFHGSWNRSPEDEEGYNVAFAAFTSGAPTGSYSIFASGFAGGHLHPGAADHRPVGVAQGRDGELYVSDDQAGRIWRIIHIARSP